MKLAPLEIINAFKSETGWHSFIVEPNRRTVAVVYGDTRKECELRTKIVYKALEEAENG